MNIFIERKQGKTKILFLERQICKYILKYSKHCFKMRLYSEATIQFLIYYDSSLFFDTYFTMI